MIKAEVKVVRKSMIVPDSQLIPNPAQEEADAMVMEPGDGEVAGVGVGAGDAKLWWLALPVPREPLNKPYVGERRRHEKFAKRSESEFSGQYLIV